jgi:hypothetical protein
MRRGAAGGTLPGHPTTKEVGLPRQRAIVPRINDMREAFAEWTDAYVDWVEECINVQEAYERWSIATGGEDAAFGFAAYRAALDREEHASRVVAARTT